MTDEWFQKEEYASLRKEVESCMSDLGALEKAVVGGIAVIFAWVAKDGASAGVIAAIAWLIPSVIALYGGLKAKAIASHLAVLSGYLRTIEDAQLPEGAKVEGWEKYSERTSPGKRTRLAKQTWIGLLVLTVITGVFGFATSICGAA